MTKIVLKWYFFVFNVFIMTQQSAITAFKSAYLNKTALIMLLLGFSAGLPYLLVFSSLGIWLREAGIDRSTVTMFGWAGLAYSFKFLWAPLADSLTIPVLHRYLGKRRSWLFVVQMMIMLAMMLMAFTSPIKEVQSSLELMAAFAVLLAFSSATQDIVIDAYRIEIAPKSTQTALSALYVFGYRLGLIMAGAGALYLATYFGSSDEMYHYEAWQKTYLVMALLMGVGVLTTLSADEPNTTPHSLKKQTINNKIMGIYALIAFIPLSIYGVWYLFNEIDKRILKLEGNPFAIPEFIATIMSQYGMIMLLIMPIAFVFLLVNQPKINIHLDNQNKPNNTHKDGLENIKLFMMFFICVLVFIFGYNIFGNIIIGEHKHGHLLSFLLESVRFIASISLSSVVAYGLIRFKIIPKEIALKNWVMPILDFFKTYGKKAGLILALIGFYRISDIVAGNIANIFYQDLGYTKVQIADASKLVGLTMSIFGAFLGGFLAQKMNIIKAMMIGAILASSTNLLFVLLNNNPSDAMLYFAVICDNLASGLASAVFVAFLSVLTSIRFTAVQYALFSSLMTLSPKILGGYSGSIVDAYGYSQFFIMTFMMGLPILYLVYLVGKHIRLGDETLKFKEE